MPDVIISKRVNRLEKLMEQLILTVDRTDQQLAQNAQAAAQTQRNLDRLATEMRDFKDEMRDFKDETRDFKIETRKQWGELANKLGTMAEDLVAPSIERILRETVGCEKEEVEYVAVRVKKFHRVTKQRQEFDVVAIGGPYALINETKSKLSPEAMTEFVEQWLSIAREYFPEYADKKIIGAIASLYVDQSLVRYGERLGLIVLGFGEDVMDVLNAPGFMPKCF